MKILLTLILSAIIALTTLAMLQPDPLDETQTILREITANKQNFLKFVKEGRKDAWGGEIMYLIHQTGIRVMAPCGGTTWMEHEVPIFSDLKVGKPNRE